MAVQAKWYTKKFECSSKIINLIDGLSTSFDINEVTKTDKNGKSKTTKKGLKAQSVSFSITPTYAAGINPRNEFESYKKLIGKTARLYIGGKTFGPYLMLTSASLSDVTLTNGGGILSAKISLTFEQSTKAKATADAKKITASKDSKKAKKSKNPNAKNAKKKTLAAGSKVNISGKYADGTAVSSADKNKKFTVKSISGNIVTLTNGKKIITSSVSLC